MTLVPTRGGASYYMDNAGNYWRAYVFIERVKSSHVAEKPEQSRAGGTGVWIISKTTRRPADGANQETIPQFHNGVLRIDALEKAVTEDKQTGLRQQNRRLILSSQPGHRPDFCRRTGQGRTAAAHHAQRHQDRQRVLDQETDEVMCIVDLDTVCRGSSITIWRHGADADQPSRRGRARPR